MIFAALTSKLQEISTPRVSNLTRNFEATAQGDTGNFEAQPLASKLTNFDISCYRSDDDNIHVIMVEGSGVVVAWHWL